mgnify:CR=1 FL=1
MIPKRGRRQVYRAHWVKGMVGTQFYYGRPRVTVTWNPRRPRYLRVVQGRKVFWWKRVR